MSSVLASGSSCSPMPDICPLASTARASILADPAPTHAGSGRLSGSSGAGCELLEEADAVRSATRGTGAATASTLA
eukprot:4737960-Alexandrium_andersonii.AAC.1